MKFQFCEAQMSGAHLSGAQLSSHRLIELDRRSPYHFAISGKSFQIVRDEHPELLYRLCVRGTVFARMLPEQKQQLIETLEELGYVMIKKER
ncbi:unnamed protein product [Rotaria sp. Silwood1]|nr:unnamed protein product [Rotaria sp. Silwood1]CAF0955355.1 unnamed protein product [Rotaria sp. Silwood1]CAF1119952.1 unnamed protein product [Rotaria sp. Silwood1]CAF3355532.1 unnamed protein product [Rotaria sp. Silwood1]CAF3471655.1 unnamed protein product [Rotaria sp. Silwood1]